MLLKSAYQFSNCQTSILETGPRKQRFWVLPSSICCYAANDIGVSSTTTKTVDCPDLTFCDTRRNIAGGKISLNVNGRVVSPACIAGVLILAPNFNAL